MVWLGAATVFLVIEFSDDHSGAVVLAGAAEVGVLDGGVRVPGGGAVRGDILGHGCSRCVAAGRFPGRVPADLLRRVSAHFAEGAPVLEQHQERAFRGSPAFLVRSTRNLC